MVKRKPIRMQHENAILDAFIDWYNDENDCAFKIVSQPDPPDAVIGDGDETTWVEVTDAFYSEEWARDLYSHATDGEVDFDMGHQHTDMDRTMAQKFVEISAKKLSKESYKQYFEEFGEGILVIIIQSPWFDDQTLEIMRSMWNDEEFEDNTGYIGEIYIGWRANGGYDFDEWGM